MKIRQTINNNAAKYSGIVYENANKIIVIKHNAFNYYDSSSDERFEFDTISGFEEWAKNQDWIVKINKESPFKKVAE